MENADMKKITVAVIAAYRCQAVDLASFTSEEKRIFAAMLRSKSIGALYNAHGKESRDNRQMVRSSSNGPAKLRGTW